MVKAQIHAGGRGKGGGVKVAKSIEDVKRLRNESWACTLMTHQTGPEGQKVRRLYIEDGGSTLKKNITSPRTDRETKKSRSSHPAKAAWTLKKWPTAHPEKIITDLIDPLTGLGQAQAVKIAKAIGLEGNSVDQAADVFSKAL